MFSQFRRERSRSKSPVETSGLYNFVVGLYPKLPTIAALRHLAVEIKPRNAARQGYVLIHLKPGETPEEFQAEGYTLQERHLRIDESYILPTAHERFITHWHCTLNFHKPTTGEQKIVHLYFHFGLYLYATINGTEIVDPNVIYNLRNHCLDAFSITEYLLNLHKAELEALEKEFAAAIKPLESLALNTTIPDLELLARLQNCQRIHALMRFHLENISDTRLIFVTRLITGIIETRKLSITSTTESDPKPKPRPVSAATPSIAAVHKTAITPVTAPKINFSKKIAAIKQNIAQLKQIMASNNAPAIKDAYPRIELMREETLTIWNEKDHEIADDVILTIFAELNSLPTIKNIFLRMTEALEIDAAIALLPEVVAELPVEFFTGLFAKVSERTMTEAEQTKFACFCKELFAQCEQYRLSLSLLQTLEFTIFLSANGLYQTSLSYFTYLARLGNATILKELLLQINCPTLLGLKFGDRSIGLMQTMAKTDKSNTLLAFFLDQDIPCEHKLQIDVLLKSEKRIEDTPLAPFARVATSLRERPAPSLTASEFNSTLIIIRDLVATPSVFYGAVKCPHTTEHLLTLAQKSSPAYLLLGFVKFISRCPASIAVGSNGGLFRISKTQEERRAIIDRLAQMDLNPHQLTFIIKEDTDRFEAMQAIATLVESKFRQMSDEQKMAILREFLQMMAAELRITDENIRSHNLLCDLNFACFYLVNFKTPSAANFATVGTRLQAIATFLKTNTLQTVFSPYDAALYVKNYEQMAAVIRRNLGTAAPASSGARPSP